MTNVRKGFGIKKDTRGASNPRFKLDPEKNGGLSIGILKEVTIGEASYNESQKGSFAEFAGKTVPTINFVFAGLGNVGDNVPIYIHSFKPMPIVPGDDKFDWIYESMFQVVKHFIDVYTDDKFLDDYEDLLSLDIDLDNGMEFEALVAAWKKFFEGIVTVFNGNGKKLPCIYKDAKGSSLVMWLKLLLYYNNKEVNNGNPGLSSYPGDGLIEKFKQDVAPNLRIAIEKGESIIPRAKNTNAGGAPSPTSNGSPTAGTTQQGSAIPSFMQK